MPELPEVETIKNALLPILKNRKIVAVSATVKTLRNKVDLIALNKVAKDKKILDIRRRAKFLIFDFAGNSCIISHLGMTGSYRIEPEKSKLRIHDRVIFHLSKNEKLIYNDIRKFGAIDASSIPQGQEFPTEFDKYGPEPLSNEFDYKYFSQKLSKAKTPIKTYIMKQEVVVGVGNIYASEALFFSGINPQSPSCSLTKPQATLLLKNIKKVLRDSIKQGGTTISDYRKPDGSEGKFALRLKVYGRDKLPCTKKDCTGIIAKIQQGGRSTFYCPECQIG